MKKDGVWRRPPSQDPAVTAATQGGHLAIAATWTHVPPTESASRNTSPPAPARGFQMHRARSGLRTTRKPAARLVLGCSGGLGSQEGSHQPRSISRGSSHPNSSGRVGWEQVWGGTEVPGATTVSSTRWPGPSFPPCSVLLLQILGENSPTGMMLAQKGEFLCLIRKQKLKPMPRALQSL